MPDVALVPDIQPVNEPTNQLNGAGFVAGLNCTAIPSLEKEPHARLYALQHTILLCE